jgi:hypothetical protein
MHDLVTLPRTAKRCAQLVAASKLTEFLRELGVINHTNESEWQGRDLVAPVASAGRS